MFRECIGVVIVAAAVTTPVLSQQAAADTAARRAAMDRIAFMAGDWAGDAWAMLGPGQRLELRQTEWVRRKVGGHVMLVEGLGRRLTDGAPRDTVFNAVATVDWLPERGYVMRSFTLEGQQGEFPLEVSDSGFVWGFDVQGGRIQYTMRLTPEGQWHERGEFIRGEQAFPIFEMRLTRRD